MANVAATQDGDRENLLRDAVTFLRDPKVTSSPLTQKAQFLESKGLSSKEIELALRRAAEEPTDRVESSDLEYTARAKGKRSVAAYDEDRDYRPGEHGFRQAVMRAPELPRRDWRDLFIMAVVSGGVMYGVASLARKYLMPHLQPPSSTAFQSTSEELAAQFDEATTLLKDLQDQTSRLHGTIEEDRIKVDAVVLEVEEGIKRVTDGEDRWREELRELRDEVAELRELVPKMIEKQSQTQQSAVQDLQAELRSLKTLLVARRPGTGAHPTIPPAQPASSELPPTLAASPPSPQPRVSSDVTNAANALLQPRASSAASGSYGGMFNGGAGSKPSIPAWQLAAAQSYKDAQVGASSGRSTPAEEVQAGGSSEQD